MVGKVSLMGTFEVWPAFIIITGLFCVAGYGMNGVHRLFNNGKPRRTLLDEWDRKMIERDHKIMGKYNFQSDGLGTTK